MQGKNRALAGRCVLHPARVPTNHGRVAVEKVCLCRSASFACNAADSGVRVVQFGCQYGEPLARATSTPVPVARGIREREQRVCVCLFFLRFFSLGNMQRLVKEVFFVIDIVMRRSSSTPLTPLEARQPPALCGPLQPSFHGHLVGALHFRFSPAAL